MPGGPAFSAEAIRYIVERDLFKCPAVHFIAHDEKPPECVRTYGCQYRRMPKLGDNFFAHDRTKP